MTQKSCFVSRLVFLCLGSLFVALGPWWACQSPLSSELSPENSSTLEVSQEKAPVESAAEALSLEKVVESVADGLEPQQEGQETLLDAGPEREPTPPEDESTQESGLDGGLVEETPESSVENTPELLSDKVLSTFLLRGQVVEFLTPNQPGIAGVDVCLYQRATPPCVKTAQGGGYSLYGVPHNTDIYLQFSAPSLDLMPMIFALHADSSVVQSNHMQRAEMITRTLGTQIASLLGVNNVDLVGKSHMLAQIHEYQPTLNPVSGATVTMTPSSGIGPIYLPEAGQTSASATTSSGIAIFFNVDPNQTYHFRFSHPQRNCYPDINAQRDPVQGTTYAKGIAGAMVVSSWICDPPKTTP